MERLLRFAVEHDRVIRLMFMRDGRLFQVNAHIVSYDDKQVSFVTTRSPRTQVISREELLAVDFRRGKSAIALWKPSVRTPMFLELYRKFFS